ncbi:hypothetical protein KBY97_03210 [Synechococcus sp. ATX 2A4]|uniref:hypothetical protein n=1 Tax=Synechococcus sp. ATX 2A4 TaxID=2823727 RepID=UPI0020CDB5FB|nr:hypothetical protein [Synechococcus sp. ATX 2A4]MCP9884138.1 hypothetical protein [Synechococcus sp. ATX 2A4]
MLPLGLLQTVIRRNNARQPTATANGPGPADRPSGARRSRVEGDSRRLDPPTTPVNISPKQPGRVTALVPDHGAQVSPGQIQVRMVGSNLGGTWLRAKGTVAAAEGNLQKLQAGNGPQEIGAVRRKLQAGVADQIAIGSSDRSNQQLYGSSAIAKVTFDARRRAFLVSQARLGSVQAQLNLVQAAPAMKTSRHPHPCEPAAGSTGRRTHRCPATTNATT